MEPTVDSILKKIVNVQGHVEEFENPFVGINMKREFVHRLPQPYRFLSKIVDQVLENTFDKIFEIEKNKLQEICEYGLKNVEPNYNLTLGSLAVSASCGMIPGGASAQQQYLSIGSATGHVYLLDMQERRLLDESQPYKPEVITIEEKIEEEGEEKTIELEKTIHEKVTNITMCSSYYQRRIKTENEGFGSAGVARTETKIACSGESSNRVSIFTIQKDAFIPAALKPFAKIEVKQAPDQGEGIKRPQSIQSIEAWGSSGALWIAVMTWERKILIFRSTLGAPVKGSEEGRSNIAKEVIAEEDGNAEEAAGDEEANPWDSAPLMGTPLYSYDIPGFNLLQNPGARPTVAALSSVKFCFVFPHGEKPEAAYGRPGSLFTWSDQSNILFYSVVNLPKAVNAIGTIESLTKIPLPPLDQVLPVEATKPLAADKNWMFLSNVTAVGTSLSATSFGVGTQNGNVSVWSTLTLSVSIADCPSHYAPVRRIVFCGNEKCVSVADDGWMHCVSLKTKTIIFRSNLASTLDPALSVHCGGSIPLAVSVDMKGELRLFDLQYAKKLCRLVGSCSSDSLPIKVVSGIDVFAVLVGEATADSEGGELNQTAVYLYSMNDILSGLFPGISSRKSSGVSPVNLFRALTVEQRLNPAVPQKADKPGHHGTGSVKSGSSKKSSQRKTSPSKLGSSPGKAGKKGGRTLTQRALTEHDAAVAAPGTVKRGQEENTIGVDDWQAQARSRYKQLLYDKSTKKVKGLINLVRKELEGS